mmetsp:Transcript_132875/g.335546  ORF Transcript_132875/g.335546 Transcript_132875/m.335546 type:complete len:138 (+) Transcript_132875:3-416(+)
MGNTTVSGDAMYGWTERPDSPIISMKELLTGLNIRRFCWSSKDLGGEATSFYIGCLLLSVGQALMASALHGERERVMVHEHADKLDAEHSSSYHYVAASHAPPTFENLGPNRDHTLAVAPRDYSMDLKDSHGKVELF